MCYQNEKIHKLSREVCQAVLIGIPYAFYSQVQSNFCLRRHNFCLLCFYPEQVRSSLCNLVDEGSPQFTILTPNLVWAPDRHRPANDRSPDLKPFDTTSSVVARSKARATTPSKSSTKNIVIAWVTKVWTTTNGLGF